MIAQHNYGFMLCFNQNLRALNKKKIHLNVTFKSASASIWLGINHYMMNINKRMCYYLDVLLYKCVHYIILVVNSKYMTPFIMDRQYAIHT